MKDSCDAPVLEAVEATPTAVAQHLPCAVQEGFSSRATLSWEASSSSEGSSSVEGSSSAGVRSSAEVRSFVGVRLSWVEGFVEGGSSWMDSCDGATGSLSSGPDALARHHVRSVQTSPS